MPKRNGKRPMAAEAHAVAPASPFRWPSRRRASEAEEAASRAAKAGLERLRARALRLATPPPAEAPVLEPSEPQEPVPEFAEELEYEEAAPEHEYETDPELEYEADPELEYETDPELEYEPDPELEYETGSEPDYETEQEREPAPALWDEELDRLTERLVAELRRDLGPEPS